MELARTKNTMRSTLWGIIYRIVTIFGPFVIKTLIVNRLGVEYSGLSTLFTSILTVLNLTNLGFSSSLVFLMYRAVAEEDNAALSAMLNFFRRAYRYVGFAIIGLGLCCMPFLPHLTNGTCPADINLYLLFSIYLVETSLDYLMFAYNNAVFSAYQRTDVTLRISTVRYLVQYVLQVLVLVLFANYYAYIIILPLMVIPNNIAVYKIARRMYPNITCTGTLDAATKKNIFQRVWTLFGHKVGSTVLVSIDGIIISAFLGLKVMGIYANYYAILTAVNALVEIVTNGSISGIGNKLITASEEDNYRLFNTLTYGWMFLIGGAATCMMCLYQPFIGGVWYSPDFLLSNRLVALIVLYFFSWMFRIMQLTYRDAAGLWTKDWLKPYVGMVINIAGDIILVKALHSVAGVLLPTVFVFFGVYFFWEAYVLFKHLFHRSWNSYLLKMLLYSLLCLGICALTYLVCMWIVPANSLLSMLVRIPIIAVLYLGIWFSVTCRTQEFKQLSGMITRYVRKLGFGKGR